MRDQLELAMEALEEENKQLREKVKLLEEVCDIAQADVKTLDKMNDRLHGELEDLHQALHDARIENSGQAAELERLREAKRWIPVKKAHPPANKMVLVHISEWRDLSVSFIDQFGVWRGYQPTHWMPLPEGPTEGQP